MDKQYCIWLTRTKDVSLSSDPRLTRSWHCMVTPPPRRMTLPYWTIKVLHGILRQTAEAAMSLEVAKLAVAILQMFSGRTEFMRGGFICDQKIILRRYYICFEVESDVQRNWRSCWGWWMGSVDFWCCAIECHSNIPLEMPSMPRLDQWLKCWARCAEVHVLLMDTLAVGWDQTYSKIFDRINKAIQNSYKATHFSYSLTQRMKPSSISVTWPSVIHGWGIRLADKQDQ